MTPAGRQLASRRWRLAVLMGVAAIVIIPAVALVVVRAIPADLGTPWIQAVTLIPYAPLALLAGTGLLILAQLLARGRAAVVNAGLLFLAISALIVSSSWVVPRGWPNSTTGTSNAGDSSNQLIVMSLNAHIGRASAGDIVAAVTRFRVDVLVVVELSPQLRGQLLAAGLASELPNSVDGTGSGVYARVPVRAEPSASSVEGLQQVSVSAGSSAQAEEIHLGAVHLTSPRVSQVGLWRSGFTALKAAANDVQGPSHQIYAGDFNATVDTLGFRELLGAGYHDAALTVGAALIPTWPQEKWVPPFVTIDHIISSPDLVANSYSVVHIAGTDHAAVVATLQWQQRQ